MHDCVPKCLGISYLEINFDHESPAISITLKYNLTTQIHSLKQWLNLDTNFSELRNSKSQLSSILSMNQVSSQFDA